MSQQFFEPDLMGMKNILVINDEAHHCYREKPTETEDEGLKGDERKEAEKNNEAARLWISGIEAVNRKLGVRRVMDLSATPFFLRGSGYAEGEAPDNLLHLVVEIKGYRREDAKEKKATMDTYWVPGVNNLKTYGRWAFAEFTDVYEMEEDFSQKVAKQFEEMIADHTSKNLDTNVAS